MQFEVTVDTLEFLKVWHDVNRRIGTSVLSKALRHALRETAKKIRNEIPQRAGSSRLARAAKPTVSYSVKTKRIFLGDRYGRIIESAKVGFGVGKQKKPAKRDRPGVGVGKANIHWFVLGTDERQTRRGANRGKIAPRFQGMIEPAMQDFMRYLLAGFKKAWQQDIARMLVSVRHG